MIPKIIHYCWFGNKKMPRKFKKYIKSWKKYCPDYEIKCWNENNYDINKIPFIAEAARKGKWAFVTDYLRMDVLYEYGGIYLDTDVEILKKFDPLLNYDAFASYECSDKINFGSAVGAISHHPIIQEMKNIYESIEFSKEVETKFTSPQVQTNILQKHGLITNQKEQEVDNFHIFPREYFCPMNFSGIYDALTKNTYSIHHFSATWFDKKERRRFLRNRFFVRLKQPIKKLLGR